MDHSPLARLPAELGNEIYYHVFHQDADWELRQCWGGWGGTLTAPTRWRVRSTAGCIYPAKHLIALLFTCRQVHAEALPVLYASDGWVVDHKYPIDCIHWLRQPRYIQHDLIRRIVISVVSGRFLKRRSMASEAESFYRGYSRHVSGWDAGRTKVSIVVRGSGVDAWGGGYVEQMLSLKRIVDFHTADTDSLRRDMDAWIVDGAKVFEDAAIEMKGTGHEWWLGRRRVEWDDMCKFLRELVKLVERQEDSCVALTPAAPTRVSSHPHDISSTRAVKKALHTLHTHNLATTRSLPLMDNSPLGRLPEELRNVIYHLVLHQDFRLEISPDWTERIETDDGCPGEWVVRPHVISFRYRSLPKHMAAVTTVCRQARAEAWPILHSANDWMVGYEHPASFYRWLQRPESPAQASIRGISVHFATEGWQRYLDVPSMARHFHKLYQGHTRHWDTARAKVGILVDGVEMPDPREENSRLVLMATDPTDFHAPDLRNLDGATKTFIDRGSRLFEEAAPRVAGRLYEESWLEIRLRTWNHLCEFVGHLGEFIASGKE